MPNYPRAAEGHTIEPAVTEAKERQTEVGLSPLEALGTIPEGAQLDPETQKCITAGLRQANELLHQPLETARRHLTTKEKLEIKYPLDPKELKIKLQERLKLMERKSELEQKLEELQKQDPPSGLSPAEQQERKQLQGDYPEMKRAYEELRNLAQCQLFERPARELTAAYDFYDRFLNALADPEKWAKFPQLKLAIDTHQRPEDGQLQHVTLGFSSQEPIGTLGTVPEQNIHRVEIEFILCPENEKDYTEASFKFRTRGDQGQELTCLRTETHSSWEKSGAGKELRAVQVDIDAIEPYSKKHQQAEAFGQNPQESNLHLRQSLNVLIFNITEQMMPQGLLESRQRQIFGADKHDLTFKRHLFTLHNLVRGNLGMEQSFSKLDHLEPIYRQKQEEMRREEEKEQAAEREKADMAKLIEMLNATVTVPSEIVGLARSCLAKVWEDDTIADELEAGDLILSLLLEENEKPRAWDTPDVARWNGRAEIALENLQNFQEIKPLPIDDESPAIIHVILDHYARSTIPQRLRDGVTTAEADYNNAPKENKSKFSGTYQEALAVVENARKRALKAPESQPVMEALGRLAAIAQKIQTADAARTAGPAAQL